MREAHQPKEVQAPHRALWQVAQAPDAAPATRTGQLLHAHVMLKTPHHSGPHRCPGRIEVSMLPCHGSDPGSKSQRRKSRPGRHLMNKWRPYIRTPVVCFAHDPTPLLHYSLVKFHARGSSVRGVLRISIGLHFWNRTVPSCKTWNWQSARLGCSRWMK
jgi:hypothetical protein